MPRSPAPPFRPSVAPTLRRSALPPRRPSALPSSARGFALLITITLVAFLVLVLVTLATLTRVETQVATNSQLQAQARQNALMALNIALGQLQKYTGPDQRVTAPADLQPVTIGTSVDPTSATDLGTGTTDAILTSIDDYWRSSRNRRWVGVWRDPDPDRTTMNPDTPADTPVIPQLQTWLVSGNETAGTNFTPQTQVANLTLEGVNSPSAPIAIFGTTTNPHRLLVGRGTTSITTEEEVDRAVVAPEVPITSSSIPGQSGSQTIGHYAWWVGDEGIKARANMIDPYAGSLDPEEHRTRLQSAQRNAIEAMTDLSTLYPANDVKLTKVLSENQLAHAQTDPDFRAELANRYHDITVHSRGVLSDTRNGGLKTDLSWLLGQSSQSVYQAKLRELFSAPSLLTNTSILSDVSTPYVSALGSNSFTGDFALGLSRSATWDQLRSYFNMGSLPSAIVPGVINTNGKAETRPQVQDEQGVGPLLVQAKLFFGLVIDASGNISVQMRPLVVLANPYDIPLTGDYWVKFSGPGVGVRVAEFGTTNPVPAIPSTTSFPSTGGISVSYSNRLNLAIRGSDIPPGEARVYSLKQSYSDTGSGSPQQIEMTDGYNPGPTFTLALNRSLGDNTHAVLYASKIVPSARLYGADPNTFTGVDNNLYQFIFPYELKVSGTQNSNIFLVYPTATGETRPGGGGWFVLTDSLTTPARTSQQANFLQFNPRNLATFYTAISSNGNHPLENAQAYLRDGAASNDAWFTADLMFDNNTGDSVRWGPVAKADYNHPLAGSPPAGVGADTGFVNILYTIPRADHPISSIPQLQHFAPVGFINNGRFNGPGKPEQYATQANTFQVNYPTGNSYPNPRVPRDKAYLANATGSGGSNVGIAYDASWLNNEVFADRFFFTSLPASGSFDLTTDRLINHNIRPFRPQTETDWTDADNFRGDLRTAASNLIVDGAFNINSTSVEAWKAILSSLRNVPVAGDTSVNVPFARGIYQTKGYAGARTANTAEAWAGFHNLSDDEIGDLAEELVLQIRRRGPFLSMADFMNRRLVTKTNDPMKLGLSGALQSAIDAILNQRSDVDPVFQVQSLSSNFEDSDYLLPTMTAGSPGYILQADLLAPLASSLSARSDTFVVRAYGDVQNPATGEVTGRAWCEAVVQRTPDYVDNNANSSTEIPASGSDNDVFGRRYEVVSFRWLSPEEI